MQTTERTAFSTRSTSQGSKSLVKMGVIRGLVRAPPGDEGEAEKAFNMTSERFSYKQEKADAERPGPGQYQLYSQSIWRDNKASNSRKGYGMLQSKVFRQKKFFQLLHTGPGPGQYHPALSQDPADPPTARPAHALPGPRIPRAASSALVRPTTSELVGPGSYDPARWKSAAGQGGAAGAFKSRSQRVAINHGAAGLAAPSSSRYDISRGILADKPLSLKGLSAFCPPQPARAIKPHEYDKVLRSIAASGPGPRAVQVAGASPGPGDYEVAEGFRRLAESRSSSTKEVFGAASKGKSFIAGNANPGPGHYRLGSEFAGQKFLAFNSPFMSQTQRRAFEVRPAADIFAPYAPGLAASKKTFNINRDKKWI